MWIVLFNLIGGTKTIMISLAVCGVVAAGWYLLHEHDQRVLADANAAQVLAQAQQDKVEMAKAIAAATKELADAKTRADAAEQLEAENEKLPTSTDCVHNPAISNLVNELQSTGRGNGSKPATGQSVHVPAGTKD